MDIPTKSAEVATIQWMTILSNNGGRVDALLRWTNWGWNMRAFPKDSIATLSLPPTLEKNAPQRFTFFCVPRPKKNAIKNHRFLFFFVCIKPVDLMDHFDNFITTGTEIDTVVTEPLLQSSAPLSASAELLGPWPRQKNFCIVFLPCVSIYSSKKLQNMIS